jgi:hypothetical protein
LLIDIFLVNLSDNLFDYIFDVHNFILEYLQIGINYDISSELNKDCSLKGEDKVIDICKRLKADTYINAIGGQHLYSKEEFKQNGIDLYFLHSEVLPKRSIIDVIMNYSRE